MRQSLHQDKESGQIPSIESSVDGEVPGRLFPLAHLGRRPYMPRSERGRTTSKFTALRWALHGRKGRKLKTLIIGGQRCTTDVWAIQFFQQLTTAA